MATAICYNTPGFLEQPKTLIRMKTTKTRLAEFLFLIPGILLVIANSLKIELIDHFSIYPDFHLPLSPKLLFYLALNLLIFISLFRLKSVIPLLAFYALQTLYLFIHFSYTVYFDAPFHARQFIVDLKEGILLARHLAVPLNIKYLAVTGDLPLMIFLLFYLNRIKLFLRAKEKQTDYITLSLIVLLISSLPFAFHPYRIAQINNNPYAGEKWIIERVGIMGNDLLDLLLLGNEKAVTSNFRYGKKLAFRHKPAGRLNNVICIQVESLDSNIIDYAYKGKSVCPFLHQLSSECIFYPYMSFFHYAGGSSDMEFTVLNGLIPAESFPSLKIRSYSYPNSVVKRLKRQRFSTVAFHNNDGNFFNRKTSFKAMGFQELADISDMKLKEVGWGAPDHAMFAYIENRLQKQSRPFFYYIITMSSHAPFTRVGLYHKNPDYSGIKDSMTRGYLNSFSYVDACLREFVNFIRSNVRNTYIFIYGDHNAYALRDHRTLAFENLGVPLFIITPDGKKYRENKELISAVDMTPTILYASGIDFELKTDAPNLLDFSVRDGPVPVGNGRIAQRKDLFGRELPSPRRSSF
jgi:lipoteichoic acid synthase